MNLAVTEKHLPQNALSNTTETEGLTNTVRLSVGDSLYRDEFVKLEGRRWNMREDIPWELFDPNLLTGEQARTIQMNAITEAAALPATKMFLRDFGHDFDFQEFITIWGFEEQKHSLVLREYLRRFAPEFSPSDTELQAVDFEFDKKPFLHTLMLHLCGEIRLTQWYSCAANWHTEPVIKKIYKILAGDESAHGRVYYEYMQKYMQTRPEETRDAIIRVGLRMILAETRGKPMHPTSIQANAVMGPKGSVQSRLPDPEWLETWLNSQIKFDKSWKDKTVKMMLNYIGGLLGNAHITLKELSNLNKGLKEFA